MKLRSCLFVFGCLSCLSVDAQKVIRESAKVTAPHITDGNMDDWQTDWLLDTKTKFLYNFANDSNSFYIRLKVSDPMMQQKVLFFGLTVFFNPESTTKKGKLGLYYPIMKTEQELKRYSSGESAKEKPWLEVKKELVRGAEMLELVGLDKEPITTPVVGLMNGLEVAIAIDQYGDLVYETKIPFKAFRIDKSKVENLGLTLETGRLIVKQPINSPKATYYHGIRYAAPGNSQPQNAFTQSTMLHLAYKLN